LPAFKNRALKAGVGAFVKVLDDKKAEKISILNLETRNSMCDAMIICTGLSERHVVSLAHLLEDVADEADFPIISIEGETGGRWVLVDCGDIVIHVMVQEAREMYNLEKLWGHDFDEAEYRQPARPAKTPHKR
jgi:ribosome-associated protein